MLQWTGQRITIRQGSANSKNPSSIWNNNNNNNNNDDDDDDDDDDKTNMHDNRKKLRDKKYQC